MHIVRTRLWRIAEWVAVSTALGWLFVWAWVVARRPSRNPPPLRAATEGGAAA